MPPGLHHVADGQDRGEVVAGMRRLQRQVGVVVIEIADQQAVDERRPIRRCCAAAEQAGPGMALHAQGAAPGDGVGVGAMAPTAVAMESMKRRLASWTVSPGNCSKRS